MAVNKNNDAMLIIEPPSADDSRDIEILKLLDDKLRKLQKQLKAKVSLDESIRRIQGKRYEIFVQASSKQSTFFDGIASEIEKESEKKDRKFEPGEVKRALIGFAKQQASKDPRIGDKFEFDNFSFLVSYVSSDAQIRHIDLLHPNMQFGLILSDKSPGTVSYTPSYHIRDVKDLQRAWSDIPDGLVSAVEQEQQAQALLFGFGDVLCPKLACSSCPKLLRTGTVLSLPGSIVHAGPACRKYRSVMFWSGSPKGASIPKYNPDTQYFASMLCCDLASILWSRLNEDDKFYLLVQMADHIRNERKEGHRTLHNHLDDRDMIKFVRNVSECQYPKGGRDKYIRDFARTAELKGLPVQVNSNEENWVVESVEGLVAEYNGKMYPVQICRRPDDSVIIKYLTVDGGTEGSSEGERYTLTFNNETTGKRDQLFDGSNGTLRDSDGEEIKCAWPNKRLRSREYG